MRIAPALAAALVRHCGSIQRPGGRLAFTDHPLPRLIEWAYDVDAGVSSTCPKGSTRSASSSTVFDFTLKGTRYTDGDR